jgi:hypothetical protein
MRNTRLGTTFCKILFREFFFFGKIVHAGCGFYHDKPCFKKNVINHGNHEIAIATYTNLYRNRGTAVQDLSENGFQCDVH